MYIEYTGCFEFYSHEHEYNFEPHVSTKTIQLLEVETKNGYALGCMMMYLNHSNVGFDIVLASTRIY